MSGFGDMMMDDGFSDSMDYMDHLENEYLDRMQEEEEEEPDSEYHEYMLEEGYVYFHGCYYNEEDLAEMNKNGGFDNDKQDK